MLGLNLSLVLQEHTWLLRGFSSSSETRTPETHTDWECGITAELTQNTAAICASQNFKKEILSSSFILYTQFLRVSGACVAACSLQQRRKRVKLQLLDDEAGSGTPLLLLRSLGSLVAPFRLWWWTSSRLPAAHSAPLTRCAVWHLKSLATTNTTTTQHPPVERLLSQLPAVPSLVNVCGGETRSEPNSDAVCEEWS